MSKSEAKELRDHMRNKANQYRRIADLRKASHHDTMLRMSRHYELMAQLAEECANELDLAYGRIA